MIPAEAIALCSAIAFGLNHFWGGLLSRRRDPWAVALIGQGGGLVAVALAAMLLGGAPRPVDLAWGLLSGLGSGLGVAMLYRGMSRGSMSVVVPISDVGAVAIPVLIGVAALGERPGLLAWFGIALALPALWAVSRAGPAAGGRAGGTDDGVLAGVGFAVQFLAVAQVEPAAGIWPVLAARVASILILGAVLVRRRGRVRIPQRDVWRAAGIGVLGSLGLVLYLLATQQQLMVLATVLTALYPTIPVVLAMIFLRERPNRVQTAGLVTAAAVIGCLSVA